MSKKLFLLLLGIFFISSVYALGCCFDENSGTCSPNSEASACSNGQFYSDATCESVGECDYGCCQIGTSVLYTRQVTCYQRAKFGGMEYQWSAGDEQQCSALQTSTVYGACIISTKYDKLCTYTSKSQCSSGNFSEGIFCSNPSLGMNCSRIDNTTCFGEDVHYLDSCGNVDEVKSDCDYSQGTICRQDTPSEAVCQNLNCDDGRKNGERWCLFKDSFSSVGSRYFSQYCLNGEVFTEPCADYRMEYCITEPFKDIFGDEREIPFTGGKCQNNPSDTCFGANSELTEGAGGEASVLTGEERIGKLEESCDRDYCGIFEPELNSVSKDRIMSHVDETPYADPTVWYDGFKESASKMLGSLGLELCYPKIQPGFDFYSKTSGSDNSQCSLGNFQMNVVFRKDCAGGPWPEKTGACEWGLDVEGSNSGDVCEGLSDGEVKSKCSQYIALTTGTDYDWQDWEQIFICKGGNSYCDEVAGGASSLPANPSVIAALDARCTALGDCGGKVNWVENSGSSSGVESELILTKNEGWKKTYSLKYTCSPWKAPSEGDCSECGNDDLPCSEYRCKALGKRCEYYEPAGVDKGYCVSSNDKSPPKITHSLSPESPIPPYSSVEITLDTNEDSICAFNLDSAGSTFEGMQNGIGDGTYLRQHKVILNVPGRMLSTNESAYNLISRDGNYTMYVRCEDPAGNWNIAPYLINFEVMQTPDVLPPVIQSISPSSGSFMPYNTSSKEVSIKLNEPSECRWSKTNKNFSDMENSFSCDLEVTDYGLMNGYFCTGVITNVTLNLTQQSKYYIKCKDQPWLEGNESELYFRNTNPTSKEYILRPSTYLTIGEVSPNGNYIIGPGVSNFSLTVKTSGGPEAGRASCSWKYSYQNMGTTFYTFTNTNSSVHSTVITNISEGNYYFQIKCYDIAGNFAYKNFTTQVRIDRVSPLIARVYNDKGNLRLYTDEPSSCKYMFAGGSPSCLFSIASGNLTSMYGASAFEHTTPWKKGFTYLVKCADFYGNQNDGCGMIIKTY